MFVYLLKRCWTWRSSWLLRRARIRRTIPGLPELNTCGLERQPDGAVVSAEALADAFAGPALVVEADGFGDLVGGEAARSAHASVSEELGNRVAVDAVVLGQLEGSLAGEVATEELHLLVGRESVLVLLRDGASGLGPSVGEVQQVLQFPQNDGLV